MEFTNFKKTYNKLGESHYLADNIISTDTDFIESQVNHPAHYVSGKQEVIETIEEAIKDAPCVVKGMLQAQVLKYILRMWLKNNAKQDAQKAAWYLERLINSF